LKNGQREASRGGASQPLLSLLWRVFALVVIDAFAFAFAYALNDGGLLLAALVLLAVTFFINIVFLVERLYPLRWISPGLFLLVLMVVYPLLYTVYIALTNYSGEHILSKQQVVDRMVGDFYTPEGADSLEWRAYRSPDGTFLVWLTDPAGAQFIGDPATGIIPVDPSDSRFGPIDPTDNLPSTIDGYVKLSRAQSVQYLTLLTGLEITGEIRGEPTQLHILSLDRAEQGVPLYTYDATNEVLRNRQTGIEYRNEGGFFVAPDGSRAATANGQPAPGFVDVIGFANFARVFTDPRLSGAFLGVFLWTFTFAGVSVVLCFALGLALALVFNDEHLPLKGIFRTLAILPYTIPGFISALVWVGLLNPTFGPVNSFLRDTFGWDPQWFADGNLAKIAIFIVNTWLGYPYMLIVILGALQSIPADLYEAAKIDGASAFQSFRKITFPLLMVAVTPLLIGSFAFNFNNFTLIDLVTQGGPAVPGATTPAGQTDILISYSFRLAFASGRGNNYAFAAAIAVFIFMIVATITLINFRLSKRVENLT
jgi:ABC-type sugar transport system permease subunit